MIISTDIQKNLLNSGNIPSLVSTFILITICLFLWIKNIPLNVKTVETAYFWNHEGSYYNAIPYVWKNMKVIKLKEVISVIDLYLVETPYG